MEASPLGSIIDNRAKPTRRPAGFRPYERSRNTVSAEPSAVNELSNFADFLFAQVKSVQNYPHCILPLKIEKFSDIWKFQFEDKGNWMLCFQLLFSSNLNCFFDCNATS